MSFQFTRNQQAIGLLSTLLVSIISILPTPAVAQQACVMTKAGKKVCGTLILMETPNNSAVPSTPLTKPVSAKAGDSVVILDYPNDVKLSVQLKKCIEYSTDVVCTFDITKIQGENDNEGAVFASAKSSEIGDIISEAIDDKDRKHTATKVRANFKTNKSVVFAIFSKNRQVPVTLTFDISDGVKTLKKITVPVLYGKTEPKVATFFNVNVGK